MMMIFNIQRYTFNSHIDHYLNDFNYLGLTLTTVEGIPFFQLPDD